MEISAAHRPKRPHNLACWCSWMRRSRCCFSCRCCCPAMAVSLSGLCRCPPHLSSSASGIRGRNSCVLSVSARAKEVPGNSGNGRRVWRRRKLTKKDEKVQYKMERIPFLEEQIRKIREAGKIMSMDIERLLLSEENRFDFVNEVAAEATAYVQNNPDEYGGKKAILHVLSNRINEAGFDRPEAYIEQDPFKPGPNYLREDL